MGTVNTVTSSISAMQTVAQGMSATASQAGCESRHDRRRLGSCLGECADRRISRRSTVRFVNEISQQVSHAAQISATAAEETLRTNSMVEGLNRAADGSAKWSV